MAETVSAVSAHSQLPTPAAIASAKAVQTAISESKNSDNTLLTSSIPSSSGSSPQLNPSSSASSSATSAEPHDEEDDRQANSSLEDGELPAGPTQNVQQSITVFSSQTEYNVKHPLYSTWTLWFDNASKNDKAQNWEELIQRVMEVESVEEFWGLYHNIVPPSLIHIGSNYYLFKEGIRPAWEDPSNQKGGRWSVQLPRDKSRDMIDKWWLYTMLAAIGETFETPYSPNGKPPASNQMSFTDEVTGVIVSSRRTFYRISIWTRSANSRPIAENIGKHFKYGVLGFSEQRQPKGSQTECEFQSHEDSQRKRKGGWSV